ncbi:MAG: hypothetical protein M1830_000693 [Pleopsidium flavum]|nr:MAG: hypothetical protein M1830_000693 [Pleopsidium flavum]
MTTTTAPPRSPKISVSVLLILFPNFNILDFAGPLEPAASSDLTAASEGASIKRHIPLPEASKDLGQYDILVVPGAPHEACKNVIANKDPILDIIRKFSALPPPPPLSSSSSSSSSLSEEGRRRRRRSGVGERVLLSICTGSLFLCEVGVLSGRKATSHHLALDYLREVSGSGVREKGFEATTDVVEARFVDSGLNEAGIRIITAGGISSGLDASIYVVELKSSLVVAQTVAGLLEHCWRKGEGVIVGSDDAQEA